MEKGREGRRERERGESREIMMKRERGREDKEREGKG